MAEISSKVNHPGLTEHVFEKGCLASIRGRARDGFALRIGRWKKIPS